MDRGPSLVIRGTLLGSFILAAFGWFATAGISAIRVSAAGADGKAEVANSAEPGKNAAKSSKQNDNPGNCRVSDKYPSSILQWCNLITHYAKQNQLEPNLVAAVMLQESGGKPQAYSHSGAVGLLQVMPRDGIAASFTCPNGPCFASRPTIEELQDPEYNVQYGTRMLSGLVDRLGNLRDALKSYGPKDVGYYYADIVLSIYDRYQ